MTMTSEASRAYTPDVEGLVQRLGEPSTLMAIHSLLDHAELLAVVVAGLDGLARKGDVISDTIAEVITEARAAGRATGLDVRSTSQQLATLIPTFAEAAPAIARVAHSAIVDEDAIAVVGSTGTALSAAYRKAQEEKPRVGALGLVRATRDDDVQRGLGFLIEVARQIGKELGDAPAAS